ncbi:MAG: DUF924 domain-containing protein [Rhizobiaceae bacterium]|nr:MAG: DUF924 domain-containing protein [Rhizobiaceae bacterium]CAG1015918.1 hypothetical protein RHIZO_05206 [Rhizobiaceae bacterium]
MKTSESEEILAYWFGELGFEDWFTRNDETDEAIRQRFLPTWSGWRERLPAAALLDPDAALAAVILFDQFPRNMFRGTADAFATDALALALARNALAAGFNQAVNETRRSFFHMPFMHSETLADQERCVELFAGTDGEKYAVEHRDIIARFGRFPHRNRALGRPSTDAEIEFLGGHAGFGQ